MRISDFIDEVEDFGYAIQKLVECPYCDTHTNTCIWRDGGGDCDPFNPDCCHLWRAVVHMLALLVRRFEAVARTEKA